MNRAFKQVVRQSTSLAHVQCSPTNVSASEIRKSFTDYFCRDNDHLYIPSSPVFSLKDPTLAFTNAGMNQFKDVFLGMVQPGYTRVANYQKCIRIGGTHNDLDLIGQDGHHHTFFEMLGNWSFGDYFKEEACRMSWDLLTKVYNLPPERLYVTYFGGDKTLGVDLDVEVREIWRKIGVDESHILAFGTKENFWTGSVTGPCGPCTEIHYDFCPERKGSELLVNKGHNEVTELWNIVFIQYDRKANGELTKLKTHFVDTGMGFERLAAVLQGKTSNYDTDLFLPLFEVIKKCTGHSGYTGNYDALNCGYRILADHSRLIAVALSDGAIPNHQSKVRGIIRRAIGTAEKVFNAKSDLLKELTTQVAQTLSDAYPEIEKKLPKIHYIIDQETDIMNANRADALNRWRKIKNKFPSLHNLDVTETPQIITGLKYINSNILEKGKNGFSNEDIFVLYDTYGVPVHITNQIALKLGLKLNLVEYNIFEISKKSADKEQTHQKYLDNRSAHSWLDIIAKVEERKIEPTKDYFKFNYRADGEGKYIFKDQPTTIEAIVRENNLVDEISAEDIKEGQEIGLILDRTQLFSEENNQKGDRGTLEIENEIIFDINTLVKVKDFVIHFGHFRNFPSNARVSVQNIGIIKLDENRRLKIMKNHTALHLVNAFLREELYVSAEKFSEVTEEKLVLKFMGYKTNLHMTDGIIKLERYIRDFIKHGVSVKRKILNHSEFRSLEDVVFIPGESILKPEIPVIEINSGFKLSREYCTGTHVLNVSDLNDFVVTEFKKGSYNVQTIEGVTGEKALKIKKADSEAEEQWSDFEKELSNCSHYSVAEVDDLILRISAFSSKISKSSEISYLTKCSIKTAVQNAKQNFESLKKSAVRNYLTSELKKVVSETPEKFVVHSFELDWDFDPDDLKTAADSFECKPLLVFFNSEESTAVQCVVPQDFVSTNFSAHKWLLDSLISLGGGTASCEKNQNPDLIFFMAGKKIGEAQLRHASDTAIYLARKNFRIEKDV